MYAPPAEWTKECAGCHAELPLSQFYRRTRSADGYQRHCIGCTRVALDAADARRRAAQHAQAAVPSPDGPTPPPAPTPRRPRRVARPAFAADVDDLVVLLAAEPATVVDVLFTVAESGTPFVLEAL